ncbi:hypothetical protein [Streptomyces sp. PTD5-9]
MRRIALTFGVHEFGRVSCFQDRSCRGFRRGDRALHVQADQP